MADRYAIDGHKLVYHPDRVARWLDAGSEWDRAREVYPIYVEMSPVGACNHRCRFCAVDYIGYQARRLELDMLALRLPEMGRLGVRSIMYAGEGEPMLHRQMTEIVELTHRAGIDVSFTTNASVLREEFLERALPLTSWIKASVNAGHADTYARVHQTRDEEFQRVIDNLKRLVKARDDQGGSCTLGAQILLLPENANEIRDLALLCRDEIGLDYLVVKPYSQHLSSITHEYEQLDYLPYLRLEEDLREIDRDGFEVVFRGATMASTTEDMQARYSKCHATPFFWAYVMASGEVYGCSAYLEDERFAYGNLNQAGFKEIWQGEKRRQNFEHMQCGMDISECRKNCRMDKVNRYLDRLNGNPIPHVNFI